MAEIFQAGTLTLQMALLAYLLGPFLWSITSLDLSESPAHGFQHISPAAFMWAAQRLHLPQMSTA